MTENPEQWVEVWRSDSAPLGQMVTALLQNEGIPFRALPRTGSGASRSAAVENRLYPVVYVPRSHREASLCALCREGLL